MGRASKRKPRDIVDERKGFSPGRSALGILAIGLSGMIVWNAFLGEHQSAKKSVKLASVPEGASTQVEVEAPSKNARTVTIKYDPNVEDIQRELLATRHYDGMIDGVLGNRTIAAIRNYQKDNALTIDGAATPRLLEHIRYTRKVAAALDQTGSIEPTSEAPAPKKPAKPAKKIVGTAKPIILDIQKRLIALGYAPGDASGIDSAATRAAILQFELEHGLAMEGEFTTSLLSALKIAGASRKTAAQ